MAEFIERPYINSWAVSIFSSKTAWTAALTVVLGFLSLPSTLDLIPLRWMPTVLMIVGGLNLVLRSLSTRPVAFIAPGDVKVIQVAKIDPPAPPLLTD